MEREREDSMDIVTLRGLLLYNALHKKKEGGKHLRDVYVKIFIYNTSLNYNFLKLMVTEGNNK